MPFKVVTAPTEEPIALDEAQSHLRIDGGDENDLVNSLITMVREWTERHLRRALVTQTLRLYLDAFPAHPAGGTRACAITLPRAPVQSITHIKYVAADGTLTTIDAADYQFDEVSEPCVVVPAYGETWPSPRCQINSVQVEFVAGYGGAAAVPEAIKRAMLMIIGSWFENRQDVVIGTIATQIPNAAVAMLAPFRLYQHC